MYILLVFIRSFQEGANVYGRLSTNKKARSGWSGLFSFHKSMLTPTYRSSWRRSSVVKNFWIIQIQSERMFFLSIKILVYYLLASIN